MMMNVLEWRSMYLNPASSRWRPTEWRVAVRTMEPNSKRSVKNVKYCRMQSIHVSVSVNEQNLIAGYIVV